MLLPHRWSIGLRAVAIFEVIKGAVALFAFVMVAIGRWTMDSLMERVVHLLHLRHFPKIEHFLTDSVTHWNTGILIWLAAAYVTLRFAEAYGLWKERHWGEWLAVLSAGLYVPAEIYLLLVHFSWRKVGVLGVNLVIIAFLGWVLWKTRSGRKAQGLAS